MTKQDWGIRSVALALALCLGGCGGGSSNGLGSTPPPPIPTPTPAPTPTPSAEPSLPPTMESEPLAATVPPAPAFPQAVEGGPTIASPDSATFPLLQSVQVIDRVNGTAAADAATMAAGATLVLGPDEFHATFDIANPALEVSNAALARDPTTIFGETSGDNVIRLDFGALDWTALGGWHVYPDGTDLDYAGTFVTGFQTPANAVPATGTAIYTGTAWGETFYYYLAGGAMLQVDFGAGTISGTLTDMRAYDPFLTIEMPWNSVSLSASFGAGRNRFSGTTAVTSVPDNASALGAGATGTVSGSFFGPQAEEIGAIWTLFDGTRAATGTIGASKQP